MIEVVLRGEKGRKKIREKGEEEDGDSWQYR
jgi:hypothetical protein